MKLSIALLLVNLAINSHASSRYYSSPSPLPVENQHVTHLSPIHLSILPAPLPVLPSPVALPIAAHPVPVVTTAASQFHRQDELGQASFGYSHPGQAAINHRDANGRMFGSWSYINPDGKQVHTSYVADELGFRIISNDPPVAFSAPSQLPVIADPVSVSPLPQPLVPLAPVDSSLLLSPALVLDTPEVMEAKRQHFAAHDEAKTRHGFLIRHRRGADYVRTRKSFKEPAPVFFRHHVPILPHPIKVVEAVPTPQPVAVLPLSLPIPQEVPVVHTAQAPTLLTAPALSTVSKFHSQDELGQAAFGFSTLDQSQFNFRDIHGNQVGHYSYINPEGQEIIVHYTAGRDGFRVLSNAMPVAPASVVFQETSALPVSAAFAPLP